MTEDDFREMIRLRLQYKSRRQVCMDLGCCKNSLPRLLDGTMELRDRHLHGLGFRRIVTYERIGEAASVQEPEEVQQPPALGTGSYRGWRVTYAETPLPVRSFDWFASHPGLSGPDDDRVVHSDTFEGVCGAVDAWLAAEAKVSGIMGRKLKKPLENGTIKLMQNASDGTRRVVRG